MFYMGIAYGEYPQPGTKLTKTGLPIQKLEREFPYLLGPGHRDAGRVQVYHTLLPEYSGKTFFSGKSKPWKKETVGRLFGEVRERAMIRWDCREQLWAPELGENGEDIPLELLAACLYCCRPFDRICVSLEEENGDYGLRRALDLILPYLPRLRQVVYVGEESAVSLMLETWIYEEYGIIMVRAKKSAPDFPWLDLREGKAEEENRALAGSLGFTKQILVPDEQVGRHGVNDNRFEHINHREVLKFLDTAVKNGYNTKVN